MIRKLLRRWWQLSWDHRLISAFIVSLGVAAGLLLLRFRGVAEAVTDFGFLLLVVGLIVFTWRSIRDGDGVTG